MYGRIVWSLESQVAIWMVRGLCLSLIPEIGARRVCEDEGGAFEWQAEGVDSEARLALLANLGA